MRENLVETIMTRLKNLDNFADITKKKKTIAVKTALCTECKKTDGVYTYATPRVKCGACGAEWLYDVTALLYDIPDQNCFSRTVLVAECEWGPNLEIMNDFQKLLLARADVRVMVFDGTWNPGYQELFKIFETNIANNHQAELGDIWLFAAWTSDRWRFRRIDVVAFPNRQDIE